MSNEHEGLLTEAYDILFNVIDAIPRDLPVKERQTEISGILTTCAVLDPGEEGPVLDKICKHFGLSSQHRFEFASMVRTERRILEKRKEVEEETPDEEPGGKKKRKVPPASDYIEFVKTLPAFKEIRRELLTDELMVQQHDGQWFNLLNVPQQNYIKSHARQKKPDFVLSAFEHHLEAWRRDAMKPQLLIDIPIWDGKDRLLEISQKISMFNVSNEVFYDLIRDFGANIFRRAFGENVQPVTPVFQGAQGIGKDSLIDALTGGLGRYRRNLIISGKNDEAEQQLHTALVFVIGEFDRSSKMDIASLKHLLTCNETDCRLKYDARAEKRRVRASFIASCNVSDIFADSTGNRRFWLFNCEFLGFSALEPIIDYPGLWSRPKWQEERAQILAQYKALAEENYHASAKSLATMRREVEGHTPEDPNVQILEDWDSEVSLLPALNGRHPNSGQSLHTVDQVQPIFDLLRQRYQKPQQTLARIIKSGNRQYRTIQCRYYVSGDLYVASEKCGQVLSENDTENDCT